MNDKIWTPIASPSKNTLPLLHLTAFWKCSIKASRLRDGTSGFGHNVQVIHWFTGKQDVKDCRELSRTDWLGIESIRNGYVVRWG
jgi:hypothetical protein